MARPRTSPITEALVSRRAFLLSGIGATTALGSATGRKPLVQTYVFTQEFAARKVLPAEGARQMFRAVRDAGFDGVELMPAFLAPDARDRTFAAAREFGVRIPIVYTGGAMQSVDAALRSIENAVGLARFATSALNMNPDPIGRPKTDAELAVQADALNRLGIALRGMRRELFVHHHTPEMADNAREWRSILDMTDPEYVRLCVDTHWAYRSGRDWMRIIEEARARLASVHVRNSTAGVWAESFGEGDLDYRRLAEYLHRRRLDPYIVVELAYEAGTPRTRSLAENLKRSREYARRIFE